MPSILITGVSTGIGRACANRFADRGWRVVGTVRDETKPPGGLDSRVSLMKLDLGIAGSAEALAGRVLAETGCPDVLLNNAGMVQFGPVEDVTADELLRIYQVNVFGQMELVRGFLAPMRSRRSGTIVNVTSLGATMTFPFFSAYNSTKWAFEGLSEGLWHELKPWGIRVKAIEPGFVETAVWDKVLPPKSASGARGRAGSESGAYDRYLQAMVEFEGSIAHRTSPEAVAIEIERAVEDASDRLRYPVAAYARPITLARRWLGAQRMMRFFHGRWMGGNGGAG